MKMWIVGSVWVVAIGSAVLLTWKINRPVVYPSPTTAAASGAWAEPHPSQQADEPVTDDVEPTILRLPVVTIVGHLRGVAEMQGASLVGSPKDSPDE